MRLANFPKSGYGEIPTNKWLFSVEINKCPDFIFGVFRPELFLVCMKIINREKRIGGYKRFVSPIGISINITRY